jgi:hypothetical protein
MRENIGEKNGEDPNPWIMWHMHGATQIIPITRNLKSILFEFLLN